MTEPSEANLGIELRKLLPDEEISDKLVSVLWKHYLLLQKWNRVVSLTSVRDFGEIVRRHYAESILAARYVPRETSTLADIGSGPGFPGFPIAAARPEIRVTLVESVQKKAAFLRETSDLVPNLTVESRRAEQLGSSFDVLTTRAVRPQDVLNLIPSVAPAFVLLIGSADADAIAASTKLACEPPIRIPWSAQTVILKGRSVLA